MLKLKFVKVCHSVDGRHLKCFSATDKQGLITSIYGWFDNDSADDFDFNSRSHKLVVRDGGHIHITARGE